MPKTSDEPKVALWWEKTLYDPQMFIQCVEKLVEDLDRTAADAVERNLKLPSGEKPEAVIQDARRESLAG